MNDITVIQKLLYLVSFLASLFSYAYWVWAKRHRTAVMAGPLFLQRRLGNQHWTILFLTAIHAGREQDALGAGTVSKPVRIRKAPPKDRLSIAGDWLAPAIVWFLVIAMSMAIVGFLLGER